ncbi:MAG: DUF4190 domain-containing protein [Bacteroidia bacterium]|jgi:hypothetical protein|nr:DUF4190 domain-containing protein [Bacteroidia bacterium]
MSNFPPPPGPPFEPGQPGNPNGNNENNPFGNPNNPPPPPNPYAPPGSNVPPPPNPYSPPGSNMPPPQNPYNPPPGNMPPPQNPYNPPPGGPGTPPPPGGFPPPNNPYGGTMPPPMFGGQRPLPNAVGVLVLGICSIVGCFCYGIPGLICGVIALILAAGAKRKYQQSPDEFTETSYKNMNAGRVCAIIGTILSALYFLFFILILISPGLFAGMFLGEMFGSRGFNSY